MNGGVRRNRICVHVNVLRINKIGTTVLGYEVTRLWGMDIMMHDNNGH